MPEKEKELPAVIDYKEYGLEETKAKTITSSFAVVEVEHKSYQQQYNDLLTKEITPETCKDAGDLRRKLVKVRTAYEKTHKAEKAFYLAGGRFVDAYKNKMVGQVEMMEEKLEEMETFFEKIEAQKLDALRDARVTEISQYSDVDLKGFDFRTMPDELYQKLLADQKKLAEIRAEEKRKEAEAQEQAEREAILESERQIAVMPYREFLPVGQVIEFAKLPELDFNNLVRELIGKKADKDAADEKTRQENERLKKEKELQDKRLQQILKYNDANTNKVDLSKLAELSEDSFQKILLEKKTVWEAAQAEAARQKKIADDNAKKVAAQKAADAKAAADKAAADKKAKQDAEKLAKAPDKTKLIALIDQVAFPEHKHIDIKTKEAAAILEVILEKHKGFVNWAKLEIQKI